MTPDERIVELEGQLATATAAKEAAERNADFLRESIGECHLMLSRLVVDGIRYHLRQDWDATTLPARLFTLLTEAATVTARVAALESEQECLSDAAQHVVDAVNHATTAGDNGEIYAATEILAALLQAEPPRSAGGA